MRKLALGLLHRMSLTALGCADAAGLGLERMKRAQRAFALRPKEPLYRWDPAHLYSTLLFLFGKPGAEVRKDQEHRKVCPALKPLLLNKSEFRAALSEYRRHRVRDWRDRQRANRKGATEAIRPWPANPFHELKQSAEFWEYEQAVGQLHFADSRWGQSKARAILEPYRGHGENDQRKKVAKLLSSAAADVKTHVSTSNALEFFTWLADQEFVCALLWAEAVERAGSTSRSKLGAVAGDLCREYAYILKLPEFAWMTSADLRDCILKSKQALANVARRFSISPGSVRPTLNRLLGPPGLR